jgi:hypothetical protein
MALPVTSAGRVTRPRFMRQPQDLQTYTSAVKSMHLSYRIASTGGGTGRYGAVDFSFSAWAFGWRTPRDNGGEAVNLPFSWTLVVTNKRVRCALTGENPGARLPVSERFAEADVAHFGNIRGTV